MRFLTILLILKPNLYNIYTKPISYLKYINELISKYTYVNAKNLYILMLDSDVIFSVPNLQSLWSIYDRARMGKDIVVLSEMVCWVGRPCTAEDIKRYYKNILHIPTISPFISSGVIMGNIIQVKHMLEYILLHNSTYWRKGGGFSDQHATTDYYSKHRDLVAIDYYQQLSGIHV